MVRPVEPARRATGEEAGGPVAETAARVDAIVPADELALSAGAAQQAAAALDALAWEPSRSVSSDRAIAAMVIGNAEAADSVPAGLIKAIDRLASSDGVPTDEIIAGVVKYREALFNWYLETFSYVQGLADVKRAAKDTAMTDAELNDLVLDWAKRRHDGRLSLAFARQKRGEPGYARRARKGEAQEDQTRGLERAKAERSRGMQDVAAAFGIAPEFQLNVWNYVTCGHNWRSTADAVSAGGDQLGASAGMDPSPVGSSIEESDGDADGLPIAPAEEPAPDEAQSHSRWVVVVGVALAGLALMWVPPVRNLAAKARQIVLKR